MSVCAVLLLAGCGLGAGSRLPTPRAAPTVVAAVPSASPSAAVSAVDPLAGQALIAKATWTVNSEGRQLQVVPTRAGRTDFFDGADARAWSEVLAKAPAAGSPGMHDQFLCHWNFARVVEPDKPSWNLEPWRPAVGYAKTVDALCNPGGPEG